MKKELAISVVLIFFGLVCIVGSIFGVFYLSTFFYFFAFVGFFLLAGGIVDAMALGKKRARLSGSALAKEVIAEQLRYFSLRINKKQIKEIKFQKNIDKIKEERECLQNASDNLRKALN